MAWRKWNWEAVFCALLTVAFALATIDDGRTGDRVGVWLNGAATILFFGALVVAIIERWLERENGRRHQHRSVGVEHELDGDANIAGPEDDLDVDMGSNGLRNRILRSRGIREEDG